MSMILAKDRPYLKGQVRILLDGADVTRDCDGFDIEAGAVRLFVRTPRGGKLIEYVCPSCGATLPRALMTAPWCGVCVARMSPSLVQSIHHGHVEVVPLRGSVLRFFWRWWHEVGVQIDLWRRGFRFDWWPW